MTCGVRNDRLEFVDVFPGSSELLRRTAVDIGPISIKCK